MMESLKISVVIPVYNAALYLQQCIDSLLAQSLQEFEIICIDDNSSDNSLQLLLEYADKDERFSIFRNETNQGAGASRNIGIDHARGKYLIFLDADDFFSPNLFERTYQKAEQTNADIIFFDWTVYDDLSGTLYDYTLPEWYQKNLAANGFLSNKMRQYMMNFIMGVPWNKLFRCDFIKQSSIRFQALLYFLYFHLYFQSQF